MAHVPEVNYRSCYLVNITRFVFTFLSCANRANVLGYNSPRSICLWKIGTGGITELSVQGLFPLLDQFFALIYSHTLKEGADSVPEKPCPPHTFLRGK